MPTVSNCRACGVRLTFEGAGPSHCPKCRAPCDTSALPPPPAKAPPLPPPEPPVAELVDGASRRAPAAPAGAALQAFAAGCARVRTGMMLEAIGTTLCVAFVALLRFAPVEVAALVSGFGKASGLLLLVPVVPLAVGNLLTAFGRTHMLRAARGDGAGATMGGVLALAYARFVLTTAALLFFGGLALSVVTGADESDRAVQAREDANLRNGGAALVFAYLLGLLLEVTALAALATVAAARNLRAVARHVNWTALAFQLFLVAGLLSFAVRASGKNLLREVVCSVSMRAPV